MVKTGREEAICRWICIAAQPWKLQQKARCWEFIGMALYHCVGCLYCCGSQALMLRSLDSIMEHFESELKATPCNHFIRLSLFKKWNAKITKKSSESKEKCCRRWENVAKLAIKQPKNDPKNVILPCLILDKIHFVKVFDKWEFALDFAVFAVFCYLTTISVFLSIDRSQYNI